VHSPQEVEEDLLIKSKDKTRGASRNWSSHFNCLRKSFANGQNRKLTETLIATRSSGYQYSGKRHYPFPQGIDTPVIAKEEIPEITPWHWGGRWEAYEWLKDYAKGIKGWVDSKIPSLSQISSQAIWLRRLKWTSEENDLRAYHWLLREVANGNNSSNVKASGGELETGKQRIFLIRLGSRKYFAKDLLLNITVKATPDWGKVVYPEISQMLAGFALL